MSAYNDLILASNPLIYWPLDEATGPTSPDASGHSHDGTYTAASGATNRGPNDWHGVASPPATGDASYAVARDGSSSSADFTPPEYSFGFRIGQTFESGLYQCFEGFVEHDFTSLAGASTPATATLRVYILENFVTGSSFNLKIGVFNYTTGTWDPADWRTGSDLSGITTIASVPITTTGVVNAFIDISVDPTVIPLGGTLSLVLWSENEEGSGVAPTGQEFTTLYLAALEWDLVFSPDGTVPIPNQTGLFTGSGTAVSFPNADTRGISIVSADWPGSPPSGTYPDAVLADNPLVYWRLGESSGTTAIDASGNGHNGTYFGGGDITLGVAGFAGDGDTAATFGNTTGTRCVTNSTIIGPGDLPAYTLEFIADFPSSGSSDALLTVGDPAESAPDQIQISYSDGTLFFSSYGVIGIAGSVIISAGVHHVVCTVGSTYLTFYIDGQAVSVVSVFGGVTTFTVADSFAVVSPYSIVTNTESFTIDEAAFYTHALSDGRIAAHARRAGFSPTTADATLELTAFTIEAWVKAADVRHAWAYSLIAGLSSQGGLADIEIATTTDDTDLDVLGFYINTSADAVNQYTAYAGYAADTLYHVALTYDGAQAVFYVNGAVINTTPLTGNIGISSLDVFRIGCDGFGQGDGFDGTIDEVAFYMNVALDAATIESHYFFAFGTGPVITSITLPTGTTVGGTTVTVAGTGLFGVTSVTVDGVSVSFIIVSDNFLTFQTPPHAAGPITIVITDDLGSDSTTYTYVVPAAPLPTFSDELVGAGGKAMPVVPVRVDKARTQSNDTQFPNLYVIYDANENGFGGFNTSQPGFGGTTYVGVFNLDVFNLNTGDFIRTIVDPASTTLGAPPDPVRHSTVNLGSIRFWQGKLVICGGRLNSFNAGYNRFPGLDLTNNLGWWIYDDHTLTNLRFAPFTDISATIDPNHWEEWFVYDTDGKFGYLRNSETLRKYSINGGDAVEVLDMPYVLGSSPTVCWAFAPDGNNVYQASSGRIPSGPNSGEYNQIVSYGPIGNGLATGPYWLDWFDFFNAPANEFAIEQQMWINQIAVDYSTEHVFLGWDNGQEGLSCFVDEYTSDATFVHRWVPRTSLAPAAHNEWSPPFDPITNPGPEALTQGTTMLGEIMAANGILYFTQTLYWGNLNSGNEVEDAIWAIDTRTGAGENEVFCRVHRSITEKNHIATIPIISGIGVRQAFQPPATARDRDN